MDEKRRLGRSTRWAGGKKEETGGRRYPFYSRREKRETWPREAAKIDLFFTRPRGNVCSPAVRGSCKEDSADSSKEFINTVCELIVRPRRAEFNFEAHFHGK